MKICIVSDSHDRAQHLAAAVDEAKGRGAEAVIHCGDIIGGNTLRAALAARPWLPPTGEVLRFGHPIGAHDNSICNYDDAQSQPVVE